MTTTAFYRDLPTLASFAEAANSNLHQELPDDWSVVVADVMGSTVQIEKGNYKNVNTIGAMVIIGVINVDRTVELPYIFGGDGATMAIPNAMVPGAKSSLLAIKKLAKDSFDIDLRVGVIPVSVIHAQNGHCRIIKYQASDHISQAIFSGRGWELAESLLKKDGAKFQIPEDGSIAAEGDFSGLQCRWNSIPSYNDHKICILIQAMAKNPEEQYAIYKDVNALIAEVYGGSDQHHPLRKEIMQLSLNPLKLYNEAKVVERSSFIRRLWYLVKIFGGNIAGKIIFKFGIDTEQVQWSRYIDDMIANTDYQKFDGALKMVLDGSEQQLQDLAAKLAEWHAAGKICYGLHTSGAALMTCLIFSYNNRHTHFIDGADGGYAMAAKQLKAQLAAWND